MQILPRGSGTAQDAAFLLGLQVALRPRRGLNPVSPQPRETAAPCTLFWQKIIAAQGNIHAKYVEGHVLLEGRVQGGLPFHATHNYNSSIFYIVPCLNYVGIRKTIFSNNQLIN